MNSVLVTGATGNVGSELAVRLSRAGLTAKAGLRTARRGPTPNGVVDAEFDFEDPETFASALDGVDRVFLVRPPQMSDARTMYPFIKAMCDSDVAHVVFLSVQGAGANPFVPHHAIEARLRRSGLHWTFLRPSFFMQNLSTTHCADIRERGEIFVPAGTGRTNFIDAADVAEAAAVCMTTPGHEEKAYEITGSQALAYEQVARILSQVCGRTITYSRPSARQFKARMKHTGHAEEFISVMASIYALARFGMAAGTTHEFEELVGRPPTALAEWAARNAGCFGVAGAHSP